jgi:HEXXH motif-containing protein
MCDFAPFRKAGGDLSVTSNSFYRGLSCPQASLGTDVVDFVVLDHALEVMAAFLAKFPVHLRDRCPALIEFMQDPGVDLLSVDDTWNVAFGDLHAQLLGGPGCPVAAATATAVKLACAGKSGQWSVDLAAPLELRLGEWLLPPIQRLSLEADCGDVTIIDRATGNRYEFRRGAPLTADRSGRMRHLIQVDSARMSFSLLGKDALSPEAAQRLLNADAYSFDSDALGRIDGWSSVCRAAMEIIETAAPEYVPWVATVVKDLVPLEGKPGLFNSGSERFSPGIVCLSDHDFAWMVAEILVHEATHHYLHIASRIGAIDDGTDTALHYSPFRNKDRPIFFIVAAYHAFANVLLFYRAARARGFVPDTPDTFAALRDREGVLARQLAVIEPALLANRALTPLGQALWRPLYENIHA